MSVMCALDTRSLNDAIAWVDGALRSLPSEPVQLTSAGSRVLAEDIRASQPIPAVDRAALDGYAVAASSTVGASSYNPLLLPLLQVSAGDPIPPGADAVIPLDLVQPHGLHAVECVDAVAPVDNVEIQGAFASRGALLARNGARLSAPDIAMLITAGFTKVMAIARPIVRIVVTAGRAAVDADGPMCRALVQRDGGLVTDLVVIERHRHEIVNAVDKAEADIVLVIGGTGRGADDHAAAALAEAGGPAMHGIAMRPGETSGFGHTSSGVPVFLLPGSPAACLFSYEMLAGRAIRRLGGRDPGLPYRSCTMRIGRKLVSSIGLTEICPVRCLTTEIAEPLPSFSEIGLMAAVGADGFVIVPEGSEGYPADSNVRVHLYEGSCVDG